MRALRGLVARRRGSPSGEDGGGRGGVFLAYGLALAATAVLLGGYLAFRVVVALKGGAAVPRQLALAVVLLALQAIANEGADWYRRSILAPIDLKARPDPDPSLSRR